jgi:hypothetical protein
MSSSVGTALDPMVTKTEEGGEASVERCKRGAKEYIVVIVSSRSLHTCIML